MLFFISCSLYMYKIQVETSDLCLGNTRYRYVKPNKIKSIYQYNIKVFIGSIYKYCSFCCHEYYGSRSQFNFLDT